MIRPEFKPRTLRLVNPSVVESALAVIRNAPVDSERPIEIVVREEKKARGLDANGYYWLRLTEIADQAWFNGKQYAKEVWHEYARQNIMPAEITTKDGEIRSKWIESPDGSSVVISTTQLERRCFADYTERVEAFGGSLGVQYSANPREGRR